MGADSFIFYKSWLDALAVLATTEEKLQFFEAICQYATEGSVPELCQRVEVAMVFVRRDLDTAAAKRQAYLDKQRENGAKGGRPRKPTETQQNPENPTVFSKTQKSLNVNINVNETKEKNINKKRKVFVKPTLEELRAYIIEYAQAKGLEAISPEAWLSHYESNGWLVGRNPMKDWRAAVRTWYQSRAYEGKAPARQAMTTQETISLDSRLSAQEERERKWAERARLAVPMPEGLAQKMRALK